MRNAEFRKAVNENKSGLLLSLVLGITACIISYLSGSPVADPLFIALILGIIVRTVIHKSSRICQDLTFVPYFFIPVGIIFYGANNLNIAKLAEVKLSILFILTAVISVYFIVIIFLGKYLGQNKRITYLTATGSAICGASAIVVTTPAVDAEPDDVSISVLSVALIGFFGFAILLPFISAFLVLDGESYCLLSGSVLQFTGLVKASNIFIPHLKTESVLNNMIALAMSVKAVRYLVLLIAIPLFSSLTKKKFHIPWFLWAFLAAGLAGTWLYIADRPFYISTVLPVVKPVHVISWSIAMAATGLNADVQGLLSNDGTKAILMALAGFISAMFVSIAGLYIFGGF